MAARIIVVDNGGTARQLSRLLIVDGGGVTRDIKRLFVVDGGGVSRLVFQGDVVAISNRSPSDSASAPNDAQAGYQLNSNGDVEELTGLAPTVSDVGDWITPKVNMANYECRATVQSGSTPTGSATATWLALSSSRFWQILQSGVGTNASELLVEIRRVLDGAVVASATITLTAIVDP